MRPAHAASADYGFQRFVDDPSFISDVVRFDLPLLGDISGQRSVHLQCHIGTDTISLARHGATMSGLDFSPAALLEARRLSQRCRTPVDFVESDVYGAPDVLDCGAYDLVFTGIGALEDPRPDGLLVVDFPYFEHDEPTVWDEPGTYVETDVTFSHNRTISFSHGLGEILTALLDVGMRITGFVGHDTVPWDALPGMMQRAPNGEWRLIDRPWRLPHTYTLQAVKVA